MINETQSERPVDRDPSAVLDAMVRSTALWPPEADKRARTVLAHLMRQMEARGAGVCWLGPSGEYHLKACWTVGQAPEEGTMTALVDPSGRDGPIQGEDTAGTWLSLPVRVDNWLHGRAWVIGVTRTLSREQIEVTKAIVKQLALTILNARLDTVARSLIEQRRVLLQRVIAVQDERCRHFSRELHDGVCQALTALSIDLEAILVSGQIIDATLFQRLERIREGLVRALEELERVILDLRPLMLEDLGLMAALCWYADKRLSPLGVEVHTVDPAPTRQLPSHLETTLYRIGQEALTNVAKHADAHHVWLDFSCDDHTAILVIRDDGRGFPLEEMTQVPSGQAGLGLLGMRERATLVGGQLEITSAPGKGTQVTVRVPLTANEQQGGQDGTDPNPSGR